MHDARVHKIAADFWALVGSPRVFPCNIEEAILWALPVAVVKLPRLRVTSVRAWLSRCGLQAVVPARERELRACVVAARGRGIIFIDGSDPLDEQRMSLAHELAHFILDYLLPRRRAIQALGPSIVLVLDGDRPPTHAERLSAVLRDITLGVYHRLWLRGPEGLIRDAGMVAKEDMADALALELLAPRREVAARARSFLKKLQSGPVSSLLQTDFGLPAAVADAYARVLCASAKPTKSVRDWLGTK